MRLRRGGRNKERAVDLPATASRAFAGVPDEPRPIQPPPSGSVLGLSTAVGGGPAGPIDEWGFYDPDLAGIGALLSTLDTSSISFPDALDEDPGDLLLRQQAGIAREPAEAFPVVLPGEAEEAAHTSAAATAVASCRVAHLAPLSLWARVTDSDPGDGQRGERDRLGDLLALRLPAAAFRNGGQLASSDLAASIGRLMHPALVAMTALSPVCRIRGIRTEPAAPAPEASDELPGWPESSVVPPPVTVSYETLEEYVGEAAVVPEPALTQALEELVAEPEVTAPTAQDLAPEHTVSEGPASEQSAIEPAAAPEAAQACEEPTAVPDLSDEAAPLQSLSSDAPAIAVDAELPQTLPDLPGSDQPLAVEPRADAETADDLGLIVEPPALEALSSDFMTEALSEGEAPLRPDAGATGEIMPAAELAPLPAASEPAQVLQAADEARDLLPQVVPPPVKRRRRTALALG